MCKRFGQRTARRTAVLRAFEQIRPRDVGPRQFPAAVADQNLTVSTIIAGVDQINFVPESLCLRKDFFARRLAVHTGNDDAFVPKTLMVKFLRDGAPVQREAEIVAVHQTFGFVPSDLIGGEELPADVGFADRVRIVNRDFDPVRMAQHSDGVVEPDQSRQYQRTRTADADQVDLNLMREQIFDDMFHSYTP